ncbi:Fanconi anaemia protein FancD2 nuclease-domain-containing protein [Syncephalis plumigaleata]|nr:Fanconi anaemia protein FancD2 nuclease-domain-containing protein [Syncephalis plumigaleata]
MTTLETDPLLLRQLMTRHFKGMTEEAASHLIEQLSIYIGLESNEASTDTNKMAGINSAKLQELLVPIRIGSIVDADNNSKQFYTLSEDSIIRVLLRVELLQPHLIDWLLEVLLLDTTNDTSDPSIVVQSSIIQNTVNMTQLSGIILRQLRWLETIIDVDRLADKIADSSVQRDIITCIPEIFGCSIPQILIDELLKIVNEHSDLTVAAIDTLSELNLPEDTRVILQIRTGLDLRTLSKTPSTIVSVTLETIQHHLRRHSFINDAWLHIVQQNNDEESALLDIIVCYLFPSGKGKKIESLFQQKVIAGVFSANYLMKVLQTIYKTMKVMADGLLRKLVHQHGSTCALDATRTMYQGLFKSETIVNLVMHIGSEASMLHILYQLCQLHAPLIRPFSLFVKSVLDHADRLELTLVRIIYACLCELVDIQTDQMSHGNEDSLYVEMNLLIKKQLISHVPAYQHVGIIGCITLIHYLNQWASRHPMDSTSSNGSSSSSRSKAKKKATSSIKDNHWLKQAILLLEHMLDTTRISPKSQAHFYDELSVLVINEAIDSELLNWIHHQVAEKFPLQFILSRSEADEITQMSELGTAPALSLSSNVAIISNLRPEIWMDIDGETSDAVVDIYSTRKLLKRDTFLPACTLFRLLQCCVKRRNNNSLEEIDALLGCGIGLMDRRKLTEFKHQLSFMEQESVVICLIYAINWIRELLNSYSDQVDSTHIQFKCLLRLEDLIMIEGVANELLPSKVCYNALFMETSASSWYFLNVKPSMTQLKDTLRPLTYNVFQLLSYQLTFDDNNTEHESSKSSINGLMYLLDDLMTKLATSTWHVSNKLSVPFVDYQDIMMIDFYSKDKIYPILICLRRHLHTITEHLNTLSSTTKNSNILDASQNDNYDETIVAALFKTLKIWRYLIENEPVTKLLDLQTILAVFTLPSIETTDEVSSSSIFNITNDNSLDTTASTTELAEQMLEKLLELRNYPVTVEMACELQQLLKSTIKHTSNSVEHNMSLSDTAHEYLKRQWPSIDESIMTRNISALLHDHIQYHNEPIIVLKEYMDQIYPWLLDTSIEDTTNSSDTNLQRYPWLNHTTFSLLYKTTFNAAIDLLKQFKPTDHSSEDAIVYLTELLSLWRQHIDIIHQKSSRPLMRITLQSSKRFMEQLLKHGFPILDEQFKALPDQVVAALKNMQQATRLLQTICGELKAYRDTSLAGQVPAIKKLLEMILFRVKAMHGHHNVLGAFWLGNLKHRNLAGEEISSQMPLERVDSEDESDDNTPIQRKKPRLNEEDQSTHTLPVESVDSPNNNNNLTQESDIEMHWSASEEEEEEEEE